VAAESENDASRAMIPARLFRTRAVP